MLRLAVCLEGWAPSEALWARLVGLLPPEEAARVARFRRPADARRALVGRLLLLYLALAPADAAALAPVALRDVPFGRTARNRPFVRAPGAPDLNISHHGAWVVGARAAAGSVGVDVMDALEGVAGDFSELMADMFTPSEQAWVRRGGAAGELARFYAVWTLKESILKADGSGLVDNLADLAFELGEPGQDPVLAPGDIRVAVRAPEIAGSGPWAFDVLPLPGGYVVATCAARAPARGPAPPWLVLSAADLLAGLGLRDA